MLKSGVTLFYNNNYEHFNKIEKVEIALRNTRANIVAEKIMERR